MFRDLALFLIGLLLMIAGATEVRAQGNCPQCDLPPSCRGEKRGQPAHAQPECQAVEDGGENDDGSDKEGDEEAGDDGNAEEPAEEQDEQPGPPAQDECPPGTTRSTNPADEGRCVRGRDDPSDPQDPLRRVCDNCELLPRKCRTAEELEKLPLQVRRNCRPLEIIVESDIDFGRVVLFKQGSGSVLIDLATGEKRIEGDIEDIGGVSLTGEVSLVGTPFEPVVIDFPWSVRMRDGSTDQAEIRDFRTDLSGNPTLNSRGELRFRFTGKLMLDATTSASGRLRGRVPISISYF